jgi:cold shock CspA family protein
MNIETCTVKNYNSDKGFGFVQLSCLGEDPAGVFFHISNVKNIKSQLETPDLKLWVEIGTNNRGPYVNRAWASRDEMPKEYLKIIESREAYQLELKAKREIENELRINGTQEEQKTRKEWIRTVTYLKLCPDFQREKRIESLSVTRELYKILEKLMCRFKTTTFNHGKGVERYYTHNYCLQITDGHSGTRHYIKRGGRPFPRMVDKTTYKNKTVEICTPSFDDMCHGILRDYHSDVLFINRIGINISYVQPRVNKALFINRKANKNKVSKVPCIYSKYE